MSAPDAARQRTRLALEPMEERVVPAVITVTNLADTGTGTLRQAIVDAESTTEADTIKFASNLAGTIKLAAVGDTTLGATAFDINTQITIDGLNGSSGITIARDTSAGKMRLFTVGTGGNLTLQGVTLSNGFAQGNFSAENPAGKGVGGAIYNEGKVTVRGSSFINNDAVGAAAIPGALPVDAENPAVGSAIPGDGEGGAIFNNGGILAVQSSTFSGNRALPGTALSGGVTGSGRGGAIFNLNGDTTIQGSTLTQNRGDAGGRQVFSLADGDIASLTLNASILGQGDLDFSDLVAREENAGRSNATGGTNLIRSASGYTGTLTLEGDPLLGPLANNGGPTKTHAPREGSPVIDVGADAAGTITDQRGGGFVRNSNRKVDLGSVEFQAARQAVAFATGTGTGSAPHVRVQDQDGNILSSFYAYDLSYTGGVNVALGDLNGDGTSDILTAPKNGTAHIKVIDGVTGGELHSFFAYTSPNPDGPVLTGDQAQTTIFPAPLDTPLVGDFNIASGDINADGFDDVVTVLNTGVAHVKAFDGVTGAEIMSYYAYNSQFTGGASLAVADMNADGFADITTGAGVSGSPHVRTVSGATGGDLANFYALDARLTSGVTVTVGDLNNDDRGDYIVTPRVESAGAVVAIDGRTKERIRTFQPMDAAFADGLTIAARDLNNDGISDLIVGPPGGIPGQVKLLNGATGEGMGSFLPYTLEYFAGVSVG